MYIGCFIARMRNIFFCLLINLILINAVSAAPADGLVFWNPADKDSNVALSNNNLDIEILRAASGPVGVRSNRAISQGEGFYYLEIADLFTGSHYAVGVGNANAPLQGIDNIADTASHELYGSGPAVLGVAVDYRGTYPVVHLMCDKGSGLEHIRTMVFRDEFGPVFL